jgi:hypothetical protein
MQDVYSSEIYSEMVLKQGGGGVRSDFREGYFLSPPMHSY